MTRHPRRAVPGADGRAPGVYCGGVRVDPFMTPKGRTPRFSARSSSLMMAAILAPLVLVAWGCRQKGVIALVIDTDMAVPAELDRLEVSVTGPSQQTQGPFMVSLTAATDPPFPRTLGLVDAGSTSSVAVAVVGFRGAQSFTQRVQTQFVDDETRMVRIVLSAACLGVTCDEATETCDAGRCVPVERPGPSLPTWPGTPPARPGALRGEESLLWAAGWRSCAPKGGILYCWGENDRRQLGQLTPTDWRVTRRLPVLNLAPLPLPPTSVGLGFKHSCVCDANSGSAYCWGANDDGQVGAGGASPVQATPIAVPGITDCKVIASGGAHTCVLRRDTTVLCWGRNAEGQAGQPPGAAVTMPRAVPGLNAVQDIKAGEKFTCALRTTGGIHCWGDNVSGQLGDGTQTVRSSPVRVLLPDGPGGVPLAITEMALGRYFACVQTVNQTVYCWGENSDGMIGSQPTVVTIPTLIPVIQDAVHIAAGHAHACAVRGAAKTVSCWGSGEYGQLGDDRRVTSPVPVDVVDLNGVTALALGVVHSCARTNAGVYCWGQNVNAQLGNGNLLDQPRPTQVVGF